MRGFSACVVLIVSVFLFPWSCTFLIIFQECDLWDISFAGSSSSFVLYEHSLCPFSSPQPSLFDNSQSKYDLHLLLKSHIFSCNEPHKQPYPFCGKRIFHICLTVQWLTWLRQKKTRVLLFSKMWNLYYINNFTVSWMMQCTVIE